MIMVKDKGKHNISYYVEDVVGMKINFFSKDGAGYITDWEICGKNFNIKGNGYDDNIERMTYVFDFLIIKYNLKYHIVKNKNTKEKAESKNTKDIVIIYINDLNVIRGFLKDYITEDFQYYIQVMNFIEFRPITVWNEDLNTAEEYREYGQFLVDNIFIPDQYFYLTPNQVPRKHMSRACKNSDCSVAKDIFPNTYNEYSEIKDALFGGFYFMPYKTKKPMKEPIIGYDLTSAYIYCLLIEKHCSTQLEEVEPENYEYYLNNPYVCSIGTYIIKYSTFSNKIQCYKDILGNTLQKGEHEVTICLTNIDLQLITQLVTIHNVECIELKASDLDYLPQPIQDVIVDEFVKKVEYKQTDDRRLKVQKATVNGIYGDTIRRLETEDAYIRAKKKATLAPQWGIFTTAYCKKLLLSVGLQVEGWILSATDSVYCLDTPKNREIVEKVNAEIRQNVKDFCDKFGYDFEKLKTLGQFKLEAEIVKFKAYNYGKYVYTTKDGKLEIKASGCNKDQLPHDDSIYELTDLPTGTRKLPRFNKEYTECEVDGKKYSSNGSYWEYETKSSAETDLYNILIISLD